MDPFWLPGAGPQRLPREARTYWWLFLEGQRRMCRRPQGVREAWRRHDLTPWPCTRQTLGGLTLHSIVAPSKGTTERRDDANLRHWGSTGVRATPRPPSRTLPARAGIQCLPVSKILNLANSRSPTVSPPPMNRTLGSTAPRLDDRRVDAARGRSPGSGRPGRDSDGWHACQKNPLVAKGRRFG